MHENLHIIGCLLTGGRVDTIVFIPFNFQTMSGFGLGVVGKGTLIAMILPLIVLNSLLLYKKKYRWVIFHTYMCKYDIYHFLLKLGVI